MPCYRASPRNLLCVARATTSAARAISPFIAPLYPPWRGIDNAIKTRYCFEQKTPTGGVGIAKGRHMKTAKDDALKRLSYIEGHLKGIRKMVEDDTYCVDILKQTYAVQRAIEKFEQVLLRDHINHCVPKGIREGRDEAVLNELAELFTLARR